MTSPQPEYVVTAYQQQTTATRDQVAALLVALWQSLPDYRNRSMRDFVAQASPIVDGAIAHTQSLTAAYLAALNEMHGGSATPGVVKTLTTASVRGGTPASVVYGRPFHLVWRQLGQGKPLEQAVTAGEKRAVQLALTDVQLAKTQTAKPILQRNRNVVGYRRQLEGVHSCALCIVAATRRYHKAELMPIHPACDCQPVPMFGGENTDVVLDPALLEAAHATVSDAFGADSTAARRIGGAFKDNGDPLLYRDVLITHTHSELGPILAIRGQKWTGPNDLAA